MSRGIPRTMLGRPGPPSRVRRSTCPGYLLARLVSVGRTETGEAAVSATAAKFVGVNPLPMVLNFLDEGKNSNINR